MDCRRHGDSAAFGPQKQQSPDTVCGLDRQEVFDTCESLGYKLLVCFLKGEGWRCAG